MWETERQPGRRKKVSLTSHMKRAQLMPQHAALMQIAAMPSCNLNCLQDFVPQAVLLIYLSEQCSRNSATPRLYDYSTAMSSSNILLFLTFPLKLRMKTGLCGHNTSECDDDDENVTSLHPQKLDANLFR